MKSLVKLTLLLCACSAVGQVVSDTPGINKSNHTAYIYAPFKWSFKRFDIDGAVMNYVGPGKMDENEKVISGQQYSIVAMMEKNKPTAANPATICTVPNFRDLINKNQADIAVLVISSHGSNQAISVEPFGTDDGAEKRRDTAYDKYLKDGFTQQEIFKTSSEDGFSISATTTFIKKYGQLGQALVYISACQGDTSVRGFVGNTDATARAALGPKDCPKVAAEFSYASGFFGDLDGQPRKGRTDSDRLKFRAVGPAVIAENTANQKLEIDYVLAGNGSTTLNPAVREGKDIDFPPCPAGNMIRPTFDTNMDTTVVPKKGDITVTGIEIGDPQWQKGVSNVLELPITKANNATSYSFELPGGSVKSAKNVANMDANTIPATADSKGPSIDAQGPAYSKATPDNYLIKFTNCVRDH